MVYDIDHTDAPDAVENLITGESGREADEIVIGEVDDPFSTSLTPGKITYNSLMHGVMTSGDAGVGKSTFMINILTQLAADGKGFCYIDPKGDQTTKLLRRLPEERLDDVEFVGQPPGCDKINRGFRLLGTPPEVGMVDPKEEVEEKVTDTQLFGGPSTDLLKEMLATLNYDEIGIESSQKLKYIAAIADTVGVSFDELHEVFEWNEDDPDFAEKHGITESAAEQMRPNIDPFSEQISPIVGRLQRVATEPLLQAAFDADGLSLYDAVANGKIIIVRMTSQPREVKQIVTTGVACKLYDVFKFYADKDELPYEIFPVAIDDLPKIQPLGSIRSEFMSRAHSYHVPLLLNMQYPAQIDNYGRETIFSNTDNIVAFRTSTVQTANELKPHLNLETRDQLLELPFYHMQVKLRVTGGQYTGELRSYPLITPRRSRETVEAKYGGD